MSNFRSGIFFAFVLCLSYANAGTFVVDYPNEQFLKDGKPFRYVSGEIHYFRIHPDLWADRLQRIRALGFNAVQVYLAWNLHEPSPGVFDFSGGLNITRFFLLAQQNELNVLVRAGPYICAEWENGGMPWWLMKYPGIWYRSSEKNYIAGVTRWYGALLPVLQPLTYKNGGPILMLQVENEFGNYGCDHNYTSYVRDLIRNTLGNDTVLYTTDNPREGALSCGGVPDTLATVDFGATSHAYVDSNFKTQQTFNKGGPKVNSEFYPGWIVNWGTVYPAFPSEDAFMSTFEYMFTLNASFSVYMVHGGSNFEFQNGEAWDDSVITSYDYNAPISENGATKDLYKKIQAFLQNQTGWVNPPLATPADPPASNYGQVTFQRIGGNLISALTRIQETCQNSTQPLYFEELDHGYGFVLYTNVLTTGGKNLTAPYIKDYGYVFLNNVYQGNLTSYLTNATNFSLLLPTPAINGDILRVLVENRGRQNTGDQELFKGLHANVSLDGTFLQNWFSCGINLTAASVNSLTTSFFENKESHKSQDEHPEKAISSPGVFVGQFDAQTLTDTFFNSSGWGKGQLFVNGFNVGRYWDRGPQVTLYVPKPIIQPKNTVVLIELIGSQQTTANFIDHAIFNFGK